MSFVSLKSYDRYFYVNIPLEKIYTHEETVKHQAPLNRKT